MGQLKVAVVSLFFLPTMAKALPAAAQNFTSCSCPSVVLRLKQGASGWPPEKHRRRRERATLLFVLLLLREGPPRRRRRARQEVHRCGLQ